jgi:MFS family permease
MGLSEAYWFDVASFSTALAALVAMEPMPPQGGGTRASLRSVREGASFLRRERTLQAAMLIDVNAMIFGMPRALFPALGTGVFGGGAGTVGLLYAAPAAGAFLGALSSGWVSGVRRQGRAVIVSCLGWGAAIVAFGLVRWLPAALVLLAVAGAADIVSEVFRSTIVQLIVPDRLRGRLSSIFIAQVTGSPRLGDAEAGAVAAVSSPAISVVTGGIACLIGTVLIARARPELGRWTMASWERSDETVEAREETLARE